MLIMSRINICLFMLFFRVDFVFGSQNSPVELLMAYMDYMDLAVHMDLFVSCPKKPLNLITHSLPQLNLHM